MLDWSAIVAGAASGSIAGAVASLMAPWMNWGTEKRRLRLKARRSLVSDWRTAVMSASSSQRFRESEAYASLRPHLLPKVRTRLEEDVMHVQVGGRGQGADNFKPLVYDDIARIERSWKLI